MAARPANPQPAESWDIHVDIARQEVDLLLNGLRVKSWPASTSRFGNGFTEGSNRTPTGRFRIAEKFGSGEPAWMEFKERKATGKVAEPGGDHDAILSRVLWLEGLDPGNANTKQRYIYFHGTNREDLIGQPASHGCVRMRNADIIELFDMVPCGTPVRIT